MSEHEKTEEQKHHHQGKSSENKVDKALVLAGLSIAAGQVILDAGCGNGYMAKEFANIVGDTGKVYALDPDSQVIEVLKSETAGTNIEAFVGDITKETRLATVSLDLIYLSTVIHGFSKTEMVGFLKEVKRLLKPAGRLAIVEVIKAEAPFGPPPERKFSPEELRQAIDLTPIKLIDVGPYLYMQIFGL